MAIVAGNTGAEAAAASGGITLAAPASPATNDIWIACIHSSDQVAHTLTDWTQIVQGNGSDTTSRLSVWYFRYAGSAPNLIVGHTAGATIIGGIQAYAGCKGTGSPVNVAGVITAGPTDASIEHAAITPTVAGCALLVINGAADDNNRTALGGDYAVRFEDSGGGTQNCYQDASGTPDGSLSLFDDLSVPASSTGIITVTQSASDPWASVLIALDPYTPLAGADTVAVVVSDATPTLGITQTASSADTVTLALTDTVSGVSAVLTVSDDVALALADVLALVARLTSADTLTLVLTDTATIPTTFAYVAQARLLLSLGAAVSFSEAIASTPKASADTLTVVLDDLISALRFGVYGADTVALALQEGTPSLLALTS